MPNFTKIGQMVWISSRYKYIYIYIELYILDCFKQFLMKYTLVFGENFNDVERTFKKLRLGVLVLI